ncbi:MAG: TonB-dependent receptor [Deltaproteobacteria bacterium]|jgi:iron complex outermembrane receptor protein|nr:TonB-dependent receptor [Deltaproteobacteria bacterium]
MLKQILFIGLIFTLIFPALAIIAQEEEEVLSEIDVRGQVRREELQSTSATVLGNKEVTDRIYVQPLDMMLLSPGTSINPSTNNGVAPTARIRTFSGSHGGDLAMYLDGIPLQDSGHTDNYIDSNLIIPLEIEQLEIIKGPASVYYGTGASGGTMAFQSYKAGDFTRFALRYGSDNMADASGIIARTDGKMDHVYAFQIFHTDGWRQKSDWNRGNFSGRWTYHFTDKFQTSLNVRGYYSEWNNAGSLRHDLGQNKRDYVDDGSGESNGGVRRRFDARLWANYQLTDEQQLTFYSYFTDLTNTRWEFGYPAGLSYIGDITFGPDSSGFNGYGAPMDGSNNEQSSSRKAVGLGLSYNYKGLIADKAANLTIGSDFLHENEIRDRYRKIWGQGRRRGPQYTDTNYNLNTLSLFSEVTYQVLEHLQLRLGARYDRYNGKLQTGQFQNDRSVPILSPNSNYKAPSQGLFQPKAGILVTPMEWLDLFANFGRGYSLTSMTAGRFFVFGETMKRDQIELGYRVRPLNWVNFEMIFYSINTDHDQTYENDPITNTPQIVYAGKTRRHGIEAGFEVRPIEYLLLSGNYTYQIAKYRSSRTQNDILDGYRMTGVPKTIVNLEVAYEPVTGLGGRLKYRFEGDNLARNLPEFRINGTSNYNNQWVSPDKWYFDVQLNYRFNDKYKLFLDITNLFDHDNYQPGAITSAAGQNSYSESWGNPRAFYLGMDINWE